MIELIIKKEMNCVGKLQCAACADAAEDMPPFENVDSGLARTSTPSHSMSDREDKGFRRVISCDHCKETLVLLEPWETPRPITRVSRRGPRLSSKH